MIAKVGVLREEAGLQEALTDLDALKERLARSGVTDSSLPFSQEVVDRFEASNMVEFSRLVVRSALLRQESRGLTTARISLREMMRNSGRISL